MTRIQFLGAAGTVTGSKHLLDAGRTRFLVDCGMFQGAKELRLMNWQPPPVRPASIPQILLTHAHIDHIGLLPAYVRDGFSGPVWGTPATNDLCRLSLIDAAHLQEEDARFANKKGFSKHKPALPLYTIEDAEKALSRLRPHSYNEELRLEPGVSVRYRDAGHILGSAILEVSIERAGKLLRVVFSGDLGRYDALILKDPTPVEGADYLVVESTYGNRRHAPERTYDEVASVLNETARRGGAVVVPAFALGRTQTLLYMLRELKERRAIPDLPVYVDSPMAVGVSEVLSKYVEEMDEAARAAFRSSGRSPIMSSNLHYVRSKEESQAINEVRYPAVIISASGMATGGRILHHLKHRLPDPRNTVLFIGFQSAGTRGQLLKDGAKEIKIHGEIIPVRAQIRSLESFSAHADSAEILRWLRSFRKAPRRTFVVHGEPDASRALAGEIRRSLGWETHVPAHLEAVEL